MFSFPKIPMISVVIPNYGMRGIQLVEKCLRSLYAYHSHLGDDLEVIVIEDTDDSETLDFLTKSVRIHSKSARVYGQKNGGFASACNHGMRESNGNVVFLVNNDIEFQSASLQYMADAVQATRAGIMGTRLLYPDGKIQHAGVCFVPAQGLDIPGYFDHVLRNQFALHPAATVMRPSLVTGALLCIPRSTIETVGYLDETFPFSAEDIDYGLRVIEMGKDSVYFGYTSAFHSEGATRGKTLEEKMRLAPDVMEKEKLSLKRLFNKWEGVDWSNFMAQGG